LAEIAHDLRSPLTSILTLAETLRCGGSGPVTGVQQRQLGLIYSAALALSATASDLIELAHGGDRLAQKAPSTFALTDILDSVRDIVRPMAEEKRVELAFQLEAADRRQGYPLALSRVLLNLTTNALKFTDQGRVEVSARALTPTEVEFAVRDTGRGIREEALATLYEPFRNVPGRGSCFSGTGLGLMICRRLVEAMGSELQLETRAGWGTRFFFKLELPPAEPLL
jgi:signal transduction histidine kinase